jgi:hypothetical protein
MRRVPTMVHPEVEVAVESRGTNWSGYAPGAPGVAVVGEIERRVPHQH